MNPMTRAAVKIIVLLLLLLPPALSASGDKKRAADQAAGKWLALVDRGQYERSWQEAATLFRQQITSYAWAQAIIGVRRPLGAMRSRILMSATYATSLPGAPDGEYVVLQYQTRFDNKQHAVETVTPMLDNGHWRVSGYYVR